ncbi:MAG: transglycosylase SLT domain-containing protein [bacterium]
MPSFRAPDFGVSFPALFQSSNDGTLAAVRRSDRGARDAAHKLTRLSPTEHMRRANVYMTNRAFTEAREHWQALINSYPNDPRVPEALLGMGRSYSQARDYSDAYATFDQLARTYSSTKEGREGLNFSAAALLRMGRPADAVARYIEYVDRVPNGERIDTAYLNVIDTYREAGLPEQAIAWVARARQRFLGTPTESNAIFGRLRLDVAEGDWRHAVATADELSRRGFQKGVLTTPAEVAYLRAFSLERMGNRREAFNAYLAIPDSPDSYYGWLASERLAGLSDTHNQNVIKERTARVNSQIDSASELYPAPYRPTLLRAAKSRGLDPRFILAVIRQESVFRPQAKSPAGARGLLQLTIDAAQKYAAGARINNLSERDLYRPETSITVGAEYIGELARMFPNMLEAVAASYNGGEDNVARWVKRARHKDPGVLTAEIGFDETKTYVQRVMSNYRAYRQLYSADLVRR